MSVKTTKFKHTTATENFSGNHKKMDEIDVGEPIQATSECLRRLRELVHLPGELQRAGYVLDAITGSDLERKRRCEKCCKGRLRYSQTPYHISADMQTVSSGK